MTLKQISESLTQLKATVADFLSGKVAATVDQLASFQVKLSALESTVTGQLTQAQADLATAQQTIGTLTRQSEDRAAEATKLSEQIAELQKQLSASETKANETLARQGLDPAAIPAGSATAGPAPEGESAWEKYTRLQATSPREAGAFYAANADQIFKTRK